MPGNDGEYIAPGEWTRALRTMRLGTRRGVRAATLRDVALTMASFAEYKDGTRIRPGIALLAVYCEVDYRTARTAVAVLRDDLGLIVRTKAGRSRGDADVYRLAMPEDITDRIEVLNPAQVELAAERIRSGARRQADRTGTADTRTEESVRVPETPVEPVDNSSLRVPATPVPAPDSEIRTGVAGTPNPIRTGVAGTPVRVSLCPPTEPLPRQETYRANPDGDLRTSVTVSRASPPDPEPGTDSPLSGKCAHGLRSRRRADGTPSCALCRVAQQPPHLRVVPA